MATGDTERKIWDSLLAVEAWNARRGWKAYDPFDGLNSYLAPLAFGRKFLRQALIQGVKRCPLNVRPWLGIRPATSAKGMAYFARGYLRLYQATGVERYRKMAEDCLGWLVKNACKGWSGHCWGNHFDYQTRGYFLHKNQPTLVWSALSGRAFAEAAHVLGGDGYVGLVDSVCRFILKDLAWCGDATAACISYVAHARNMVHNANLLGAAMLSYGYGLTGERAYLDAATRSARYSVRAQLENGAWYYGEERRYRWIDNWHTAYNLDALKIYAENTGRADFQMALRKGFRFYLENFFTTDGRPKMYADAVFPIDIQCCSQSIDTLTLLREESAEALNRATSVARYTIDNMLSADGHFYHWRGRMFVNRTPTFHWGQATMFHALAHLYGALRGCRRAPS